MIVNVGSHEGAVVSLAFSNDGKLLATGGQDRAIRLWALPQGLQGVHLQTSREWAHRSVSFAFSGDGARLASGLDNGTVQFWDVGSQLQERTVIAPTAPHAAQQFSALEF